MAEIRASIRHNAGGLIRLSGRETRAQYWPWTLMLFLLSMLGGMIAMMPVMAHFMNRIFGVIVAAQAQGGKPVPEAEIEAQMQGAMAGMAGDMASYYIASAAIQLLFVLLIAAATVRRLHDRGWSGWWALLPLPFNAIALVMAPVMMRLMIRQALQTPLHATGPMIRPPFADPGLNLLLAVNSLAYYAALGFLIYLLVTDGTRGPNRFGPDPYDRRPAG